MRIILNPAKQHEHLELTFPDKGVVLLKAPSGYGKSSIFEAIRHAFYGTSDEMIPWGGKSARIELHFQDHIIIRTHGPVTLTVTDPQGQVYKDDAAQAIINNWMGMTAHEFDACSYIQQDDKGSLLTKPPSEQLRFIQKLSMGKYDVEEVRKRIKKKNDVLSEEVRQLESALIATQRNINSQQETLDKAETIDKPVSRYTAEEIEKKKTEMANLREAAKISRDTLQGIDETLQSGVYDLIANFDAQKAQFEQMQSEHDAQVEKLQSKLAAFAKPWSEMSREDVAAEKKKIAEKDKGLSCRKQLLRTAEEVYDVFPETRKLPKLTDFLANKSSALSAKISSSHEQVHKLKSEKTGLDSYKEPQKCPKCKAPLAVVFGLIQLAEDMPVNFNARKTQVDSALAALVKETSQDEEQKSKVDRIINLVKHIRSNMPTEDPYPEIKTEQELTEKASQLDKYAEAQTDLEHQIALVKNEIEQLASNMSRLSIDLERRKKKISDAGVVTPKEWLFAEKKDVADQLDKINEKANSYNDILTQYQSHEKHMNLYNQQQSWIAKLQQSLEEAKAVLADQNQQLKVKHDEWAAVIRLRELSNFAAAAAIERTVECINQNAQVFLDQQFVNDGTTIQLKNFSTTTKGEERARMGVEIYHKGHKVKRIKPFSGGEKSRSCLSFQLGLSEMYQSPILIVDEGFTGVDEDTKTACFNVLRSVSQDKLILVVEHGAPESFFDEVIEL